MADQTEAQAVAELAAEAAEPKPVDPGELYSLVVPQGAEQVTLDMEKYLPRPRRAKGTAVLHDAASFAAYATTSGTGDIYADLDTFTVAAVFNGHNANGPGWGDHRGTLTLRKTPQWVRWAERDNKIDSQVRFAEHIEENIADIQDPPGAEMLELAQHFEATAKVTFKSSRLLSNGQRGLQYEETIDAKAGQKGELVIPREFLIAVAPFEGCEPEPITARLRYRLDGGDLRIGYQLAQPDDVLRAAFLATVTGIETSLAVTAYRGIPIRAS